MSRDGTLAVVELAGPEADDARDEWYEAMHTVCAVCGTDVCLAAATCPVHETAAIQIDRFDAVCSARCLAEYEAS